MDNKERANRFHLARVGFNQHGEETKAKVYELTGVPASVIVAYEDPNSTRSLKISNVQKLADHYGVNAAWLLGQSESWSLESDIRQISEGTGLSPEAIWALKDLTKNEEQRAFVNAFLASEEFSRIIHVFSGKKPVACSEPVAVVDYTQAMTTSGNDDIGFSEGDIRDMKLWKASRDIENLLKKITL